MRRASGLACALVVVGSAAGCSSPVSLSGSVQPDTTAARTTPPSSAPPVNDESPSVRQDASHRATVVTNAGRIEAAVVDSELEMDVTTETGWHSAVERDDAAARVVWTSGERSVVVELRGTSSGISQQVVSHG